MDNRGSIIINYIEGYNTFNVDKMIMDLSPEVVFQHVEGENVTLTLKGREAFYKQALEACDYFSERKQSILSFHHKPNETIIEVYYYAVLAKDMPDGLKKGDEIRMRGKSVFKFLNGKVIELRDIVC